MLRQDQLTIVSETWIRLMKRSTLFESTFLTFLLEVEPRIQEVYSEQKLTQSTPAAAIVDRIVTNTSSVKGVLEEIMTKYSCYGITEECVEKISLAFLLTIEKLLGSKWNNSVRDAWAMFISTTILISKRKASAKENDRVHL